MAKPNIIPGKSLPASIAKVIKEFYELDSISRIMPGKKDFVSVIVGDQRIHKQKRLILCNLKELFHEFKNQHPDVSIGFSKFAELRPKQHILAGAPELIPFVFLAHIRM